MLQGLDRDLQQRGLLRQLQLCTGEVARWGRMLQGLDRDLQQRGLLRQLQLRTG